MSSAILIFTLGHSNHPIDAFVGLLKRYDIQVVVDVRSQPHSTHAPQYNLRSLKRDLAKAGFQYVYLGQELGGRPGDSRFYDASGRVMYSRVARSSDFMRGIGRLEEGARKFRVAILCSEENPAVCHRHLLVGRVLGERGAMILHIRGDGRVQSGEELGLAIAERASGRQTGLFEGSEDPRWRSIRSVLRGKRQKSSSRHSRLPESSG